MVHDLKQQRIQKIKEMLQSKPKDSFLNFALSMEYVGLNKDEAAIELLEHLYKEQPNYLPTYYHLGKLYQKHQRAETAQNVFEKGIALGRVQKDQHAVKELNDALNELLFED